MLVHDNGCWKLAMNLVIFESRATLQLPKRMVPLWKISCGRAMPSEDLKSARGIFERKAQVSLTALRSMEKSETAEAA